MTHSLLSLAAFPNWEELQRVLLLTDYNTRIVIIGTTLLGAAAGMVGSFTLLRKRSLMGDALSHATLPGIALAFILAPTFGLDGKSLGVLLFGATLSGLLGVVVILAIRSQTRLKEDTALGAVLSVFFGAGVALLGVIQKMNQGHAAGLESFILGKTATMSSTDLQLIFVAGAICVGGCILCFKELKLLCFDDVYAGSRGYRVLWIDILLMGLVVVVTIVGLQAVGLILVIALLVIPAAAARFWTSDLRPMFIGAGIIGAVSGYIGAGCSALFPKLPSGAMIVLVSTNLFLISMVFGTRRGILSRARRRQRLNRSIDRQHLLRAIYESLELTREAALGSVRRSVTLKDLLPQRSWSMQQLHRILRRTQSEELVEWVGSEIRLTRRGIIEARRLTRQHRLWELYLINYADVAPGRVDRDADAIEHVLEPEIVSELEKLLQDEQPDLPASPHDLSDSGVFRALPEGGSPQ